MLSIFCSPARYVQGRDATKFIGEEIKKMELGRIALIVASQTAHALLESTWKESFSKANIEYFVVEFTGECCHRESNRLVELAKNTKADLVIGAGGGKVLDTARAVAGKVNVPVVNCPTLASSDAPCSALSVVYTEDGEFQEFLFYRRNPDLVLVDSSIVSRAPARFLVAGMGDALATMFEARTCADARKKNQVGGASTITALALADLCYETLLADSLQAIDAVKSCAVTPALERIIEANTLLSGLGFESGGLAIAHSVHNGLTTVRGTHKYLHGEKVAFGLLVQLIAEGQNTDEISEVLEYSSSVGLPITLDEIGVDVRDRSALLRVAERAVAPGETAHNEPFDVTPELIVDAIVAADSIGHRFKRENMLEEVEELVTA